MLGELYVRIIWYIYLGLLFSHILYVCLSYCNKVTVGLSTTYAISAYQRQRWEFDSRYREGYSRHDYVIKFVRNLRRHSPSDNGFIVVKQYKLGQGWAMIGSLPVLLDT
jgi:hypothetical protein